MADKRMISNTIYDQDEFLDMPTTARDLYTYLNLAADDEGFVGNAKSIMRKIRASEDDLKILLAKRFILSFETGIGVVVVKHWLIHNTLRQDRIKETTYLKEKQTLELNEYGAYTEHNEGVRQVSDKRRLNNTNLIYTDLDFDLSFIKEIIDYLNIKTNTKYRYNNTRTNSLIKGRISEGYTIEDIKKVIDVKCDEWLNTDMAKYLRPETLFNATKFQSYINQKGKPTINDRW